MKKPKAIREIPASLTRVDASGHETHEAMSWKLLPPAKDKCQICAVAHALNEPHNQQSLYYQTVFHGMIGRMPTWADAMAHCSDDVKQRWQQELMRRRAWSSPLDGEAPVAHLGI